jgi:hypothetical protein
MHSRSPFVFGQRCTKENIMTVLVKHGSRSKGAIYDISALAPKVQLIRNVIRKKKLELTQTEIRIL